VTVPRSADRPTEKTCSRCEQTLPLEAFHRDAHAADGRRRECKACRRPSRREKEAHAAYMRAYRATASGKAAAKRYRSSAKGKAAQRRYAKKDRESGRKREREKAYREDGRSREWQRKWRKKRGKAAHAAYMRRWMANMPAEQRERIRARARQLFHQRKIDAQIARLMEGGPWDQEDREPTCKDAEIAIEREIRRRAEAIKRGRDSTTEPSTERTDRRSSSP
jgi:hypothetical protein